MEVGKEVIQKVEKEKDWKTGTQGTDYGVIRRMMNFSRISRMSHSTLKNLKGKRKLGCKKTEEIG